MKSEESSSFVKKNRCGEYVGVRKLWQAQRNRSGRSGLDPTNFRAFGQYF